MIKQIKQIWEYIRREPAVLLSLITAGAALAATFGFSLTQEQVGAIVAFVAVLIGLLTRQVVVPAKSVMAYQTIKGEVVTGKAAPPEGDPAAVVTNNPYHTGLGDNDPSL